jgi:hypothetical protein
MWPVADAEAASLRVYRYTREAISMEPSYEASCGYLVL